MANSPLRRQSSLDSHNERASSPDSPPGLATSKKRKRPRREPDHKHVCDHPGCSKPFTRLEHLRRHKLNHEPKEIFHCDYPQCSRRFVRKDLCLRHQERHSVRGTLDVLPGKPARTFRIQSSSIKPRAGLSHPSLPPRSRAASNPSDHSPQPNFQTILDTPLRASPPSIRRSDGSNRGMTLPSITETAPKFTDVSICNTSDSSDALHALEMPNHLPSLNPLPRPLDARVKSPAWSDTSSRPPEKTQQQQQELPITAAQFDLGSTSTQYGPALDRWAFPDDTTAWLFGMEQSFDQTMLDSSGIFTTFDGANLSDVTELSPTFLHEFGSLEGARHAAHLPHPMSISSIVDFGQVEPECTISQERRRALADMIAEKFDETDQCPGVRPKSEFVGGDQAQQHHPLSQGMMQTYLSSYWTHFHPQMPILHKPTFSADHAPDLLIIAIIVLGASCLDRVHGYEATQICAELACFLAWHLRWAIFKHPDFRPPAKLWVFQSLILLEYYEKMYATKRTMHERAHIHHGTTLALMRRGSFLAGKSAVDPDQTASANDVQLYGRARKPMASIDSWWHNWAVKEATRRAVLGAFVMDTTHAILFGHTAVMGVHEMRLPLPCDESLWRNTNGAEVARAEKELRMRNDKPPMFLDCLKQTLNGQKVQTNTFGRTVLMTGLLSVSWHMSQRDLQISSLGVAPSVGGTEKWRTSLKRAFNWWKRDFDECLAEAGANTEGQDASVEESRVVLHHLAHMSLHSDIVDAQIFAGAPSQLGRRVNPQDRAAAERRIREMWAPTPRAREATYHALQFLRKVLISEELDNVNRRLQPSPSQHQAQAKCSWSARDDDLLNRPWLVFYAALLVWCYAYALEGPIRSPDYSVNHANQARDMRLYLRRVGGIGAPEELKEMAHRNHCIGLLMTLRDVFLDTRWQLLHEASRMLHNCIDMLAGKGRSELPAGLPPGD